ncbi:MAG: cation diffusion facilitator family transporter [Gammaproteobacteria bacterium]|nr:cation diffusion facilitator family transporter [Gammaproteobacteria bacterium]
MAQANSVKSIIYALVANFAIAIAKLVAAFITNSGSMMAESIHSFADCGNQGLLLLGVKNAKRPPDLKHPLGYGKTVYFWSFIVAIMLFSMGGLFSIYEGSHKLHETDGLSSPLIAIGVLVFAIIAESLSLAGCMREINKVRGIRSYYRWFKETRQSELMVIFGEDIAALFGLVFALLAVTLTMITGNPIYDAFGSIVIGILLLIIAILIGKEVKDLIIGQGVETTKYDAMISLLNEQESIDEVYNLLTLQLGSDVMVAIKARMTPQPSDTELIHAINKCEEKFRRAFPEVVWCFFEPDLKD